MKYILITILSLSIASVKAQAVKNTSYTTLTGDKVLRLEVILPIDKLETWQLFTSDEQLIKWIAPVAHIELKTGGYILTNYDKTKSLSDSSLINLFQLLNGRTSGKLTLLSGRRVFNLFATIIQI